MTTTENNIKLYVTPSADSSRCNDISQFLNIEPTPINKKTDFDSLSLLFDENGLSICQGNLSLKGDLSTMIPRLKVNNLNGELLVRASKIKNLSSTPTALDATAGLGEDSLLLAASGYNVTLYEYNPIIAALLKDSVTRALSIPELQEAAARMQVYSGDSIQEMQHSNNKYDFILLDPMFPARNKTGLIKKKFQLLQQLETPCTNESDLLSSAMQAHPSRIAIKRPAKGPYLDNKKPDYSLTGKSIRYDCFVFAK